MTIESTRLNGATLTYTAEDIEGDFDIIPVASAANAYQIAKTSPNVLSLFLNRRIAVPYVVVDRASSATLTRDSNLTIQTNSGAVGAVNLNLWSPLVGDAISFVRLEEQTMTLTPASGLKVGEGDADAVLTMLTEGRLNLRCYDAGHWVVESHSAEYDYV